MPATAHARVDDRIRHAAQSASNGSTHPDQAGSKIETTF